LGGGHFRSERLDVDFDFACAGILVYLMIMSVIIDEYSLEYLGGGF